MDDILKSLENSLANLTKINNELGFTERVQYIKSLIEIHGWGYVSQKFHPDNNCDDPAAHAMYKLVKFIYETML